MVDIAARLLLSRCLRRLVAGRITTDEYEDAAFPLRGCGDAGVDAIVRASWFLYRDDFEHRLVGRHAPSENDRRRVARWLLFLDGAEEYRWPPTDGNDLRFVAGRFADMGRSARLARWLGGGRAAAGEGDPAAWPFFSRAEYRSASGVFQKAA